MLTNVNYLFRYLFWLNQVSPRRIERTTIVGLARRIIIDEEYFEVTAMTVDMESDLLYWVDDFNKKIECTNLEGEDRRVLVTGGFSQANSLAVFGKYLYWTDREQRHIERVNKITGTARQVIYSRLNFLSAIKAVVRTDTTLPSQACQVSLLHNALQISYIVKPRYILNFIKILETLICYSEVLLVCIFYYET
jgi:hypothetical protein